MLDIKKNISICSLALTLAFGAAFTYTLPSFAEDTVVEKEQKQVVDEYQKVDPNSLILNPKFYLNKKVKMTVLFDKFSTLGLDYEPAFRDSQKYISFLIKRVGIKDHNIPLSELKIIIKRDYAEKHLIDIESGDKIEIKGSVFSVALNDPWIEVDEIKVLTKKEKKSDNTL